MQYNCYIYGDFLPFFRDATRNFGKIYILFGRFLCSLSLACQALCLTCLGRMRQRSRRRGEKGVFLRSRKRRMKISGMEWFYL